MVSRRVRHLYLGHRLRVEFVVPRLDHGDVALKSTNQKADLWANVRSERESRRDGDSAVSRVIVSNTAKKAAGVRRVW